MLTGAIIDRLAYRSHIMDMSAISCISNIFAIYR